jgi:hypothetical protein
MEETVGFRNVKNAFHHDRADFWKKYYYSSRNTIQSILFNIPRLAVNGGVL